MGEILQGLILIPAAPMGHGPLPRGPCYSGGLPTIRSRYVY